MYRARLALRTTRLQIQAPMTTTFIIDGEEHPRICFGAERSREDSPCPDCGTYYGDVHQVGCEVEECPKCGGQVVACSCLDAPLAG
ncbi:MAG: hypothetical protein NVS3B20_15690 [Polyangiales bacterium]